VTSREMKTMKLRKNAMLAMAASTLVVVLGGCPQKEGPGERAGKAVDNAANKAGQKIEKAGEAVQDAAKNDNKK
jgi:hypothetical protein